MNNNLSGSQHVHEARPNDTSISYPTENAHSSVSGCLRISSSDLDPSLKCGIFQWRPFCLQRARNIRIFLAAACFISFLQAAYSGYISSQVTTLEKRFAIGSSVIGFISSSFEIGYIISVVFVSYSGSGGHVPRWVASGLLAMAAGAFLWSSTHFIFPQPVASNSTVLKDSLCKHQDNLSMMSKCDDGDMYGYAFLPVLLIGQFLIGAGSSPILTLTPPFIDDHVAPNKAPPMIASQYAAAAMGPVFGYGLGALVLQYPADFFQSNGLTPDHPDWIGAWWGGYIVLGILVLLGAFILLFFPRRLNEFPKNVALLKGECNITVQNGTAIPAFDLSTTVADAIPFQTSESLLNKPNPWDRKLDYALNCSKRPASHCCLVQLRNRMAKCPRNWSKFAGALSSILRNKIYLVVCLCICSEMFLIIGYSSFLPKYLEAEYRLSKSITSIIAGGLIVPAGAIGILVGGLILNRFKLHRRSAIHFVLCVNVVIIGCVGSFFLLGCSNPLVSGITADYPSSSSSPYSSSIRSDSNSAVCNADCSCDPNQWSPVCHRVTSISFISPCNAGCKLEPTVNVADPYQKIFSNCTCALATVSVNWTRLEQVQLHTGLCPLKCDNMMYFVAVLTLCLFLTGVIQNPLLMVTMRSVNHSERSFALGLQFVIIRLLANLPSPIVFGRVIDSACRHWRYQCGRRGDCAFLDARNLNLYLIGLALAIKGGGLLFYFLLIFMLRSSRSIQAVNCELNGVENTTPQHVEPTEL